MNEMFGILIILTVGLEIFLIFDNTKIKIDWKEFLGDGFLVSAGYFIILGILNGLGVSG